MSQQDDPFHDGERDAQEYAGSRQRALQMGRANIRDSMSETMRAFFEILDFVIVGVPDAHGLPQAMLLAGGPGSIKCPSPSQLTLQVPDAQLKAFPTGVSIGLLGICPRTGGRVRANGRVTNVQGSTVEVCVFQCFGNCSRYVHSRQPIWTPPCENKVPEQLITRLNGQVRNLVSQADTFFIASAHPFATESTASASFGVDVSHRGGPAGFVQCDEAGGLLTVPDYNGNAYFNTVGNLMLHPRAGLLFIDFKRGDLLRLSVQAEVLWNARQADGSQRQSERLLRLTVVGGVWAPGAMSLRWY